MALRAPVRRTIAGGFALALALIGGMALDGGAAVRAQTVGQTGQASTFMRFTGSVRINNRQAADGTSVLAVVGNAACGATSTVGGNYLITVRGATLSTICAGEGSTVNFVVAGQRADQFVRFRSGGYVELNLFVSIPAQRSPMRVQGTASIAGRFAPDGSVVEARIGSTRCGVGVVTSGGFSIDVHNSWASDGCGVDGAPVQFVVADQPAAETVTFRPDGSTQINLTVGGGGSAAPPVPTTPTTSAPSFTPSTSTPTFTPSTGATSTAATSRPAATTTANRTPMRFLGTASIDGKLAVDGTSITAAVGGTTCGRTTVQNSFFVLDIAGCGAAGDTITFQVADRTATETAKLEPGGSSQISLSVGAAPMAAPATAPTAASATTATATPPATSTLTTPGATAALAPVRFFGALAIDGAPAPEGTVVLAQINGQTCGVGVVTADGAYSLEVSYATAMPGCGNENDTVIFMAGDRQAKETGLFWSATSIALDLTVTAADPPPPEEAPAE